jgi:hypothetical protein
VLSGNTRGRGRCNLYKLVIGKQRREEIKLVELELVDGREFGASASAAGVVSSRPRRKCAGQIFNE